MRRVAIGLIVGLGFVGVSCSGSSEPPACANPVQTADVDLVDFVFDPTCASVEPGATLTLNNTGSVPHTFTVEGTDIDVQVAAGQTGEAPLGGVPAGTYRVTCTYHPQMVGALEVG